MELAVTIDAGMPFVQSTYNLEGDGPLALTCYDIISALSMSARQAHYPNLDDVAAHIAAGNTACKEVYPAWDNVLFRTNIDKYEGSS